MASRLRRASARSERWEAVMVAPAYLTQGRRKLYSEPEFRFRIGVFMIVVTTPTGQIGNDLLRQLLGRESKIKVIARDAARLADDVRERIDVVGGAHDDPAVLDAALPGADALF